MKNMVRLLSCGFALLFAMALRAPLQAQDTLVIVFGTVKDYPSLEPLADIVVKAVDEKTGLEVPPIIRGSGRYELNIMQEGDYRVEFSAPGRVPKQVRLELRGPSAEQWKGGYGMNVDITLFREVEGLDLTLGGKPFGVCRYDKYENLFNWDLEYTSAQRDRIAQLLKEYEQRMPSAR